MMIIVDSTEMIAWRRKIKIHFVLVFLMLLLLSICYPITASSNKTLARYEESTSSDDFQAVITMKSDQLIKELSRQSLFEKCSNCINISCGLKYDPACNFKMFYNHDLNLISMQLTVKTPKRPTWLAIGLNPHRKMIGTDAIIIRLVNNDVKIYNGFIKYYNSPLISSLVMNNIHITESNGVTTIAFDRPLTGVNKNYLDINKCNHIVVGNGQIVNNMLNIHSDLPVFTAACYFVSDYKDSLFKPLDTTVVEQPPVQTSTRIALKNSAKSKTPIMKSATLSSKQTSRKVHTATTPITTLSPNNFDQIENQLSSLEIEFELSPNTSTTLDVSNLTQQILNEEIGIEIFREVVNKKEINSSPSTTLRSSSSSKNMENTNSRTTTQIITSKFSETIPSKPSTILNSIQAKTSFAEDSSNFLLDVFLGSTVTTKPTTKAVVAIDSVNSLTRSPTSVSTEATATKISSTEYAKEIVAELFFETDASIIPETSTVITQNMTSNDKISKSKFESTPTWWPPNPSTILEVLSKKIHNNYLFEETSHIIKDDSSTIIKQTSPEAKDITLESSKTVNDAQPSSTTIKTKSEEALLSNRPDLPDLTSSEAFFEMPTTTSSEEVSQNKIFYEVPTTNLLSTNHIISTSKPETSSMEELHFEIEHPNTSSTIISSPSRTTHLDFAVLTSSIASITPNNTIISINKLENEETFLNALFNNSMIVESWEPEINGTVEHHVKDSPSYFPISVLTLTNEEKETSNLKNYSLTVSHSEDADLTTITTTLDLAVSTSTSIPSTAKRETTGSIVLLNEPAIKATTSYSSRSTSQPETLIDTSTETILTTITYPIESDSEVEVIPSTTSSAIKNKTETTVSAVAESSSIISAITKATVTEEFLTTIQLQAMELSKSQETATDSNAIESSNTVFQSTLESRMTGEITTTLNQSPSSAKTTTIKSTLSSLLNTTEIIHTTLTQTDSEASVSLSNLFSNLTLLLNNMSENGTEVELVILPFAFKLNIRIINVNFTNELTKLGEMVTNFINGILEVGDVPNFYELIIDNLNLLENNTMDVQATLKYKYRNSNISRVELIKRVRDAFINSSTTKGFEIDKESFIIEPYLNETLSLNRPITDNFILTITLSSIFGYLTLMLVLLLALCLYYFIKRRNSSKYYVPHKIKYHVTRI